MPWCRKLVTCLWMALLLTAIHGSLRTASAAQASENAGLKVVVIEGEDAVNIIQQKTAVAPVIEVRDRNDQPVAGATVNFAIRAGRATFSGARTLTVTTNAAGRAAAAGLTPTASGAVQISATAAFQGQTAAAVTIAQTNVMTAAQAAAVSSAASSSGGGAASGTGASAGGGGSSGATAGAGAGAGGAGGGLSATTIGIIGGAVAGGALAATKLVGGAEPQTYSGPFAFNWNTACLVERISGTIVVDLEASTDAADATISNGRITLKDTTANDVSRPAGCAIQGQGNWGMPDAPLTGTLSSFAGHGQDSVNGRGVQVDRNYDFTGSLANGVINGTFAMTWRFASGPASQSSGSGPVTLNHVQ